MVADGNMGFCYKTFQKKKKMGSRSFLSGGRVSLYLHLPFCQTICTYCDFCKIFYHQPWVQPYFHQLQQEFKSLYHGEVLETIYIGGGTPNVLSDAELTQLLEWLDELPKTENCEYTIECNVELLTESQLNLFHNYGINRLSIGIQTVQSRFLHFLGRHHIKEEVQQKVRLAKQYPFSINLDLMYAFPTETIDEVTADLEFFLSLNVDHISTYSLMIEPHTTLFLKHVKPVDEDLDDAMYQRICSMLKQKYQHYEISNFCKQGKESRHNLTYWQNRPYYGIGVGASGYNQNIRYTNTKSFNQYIQGNYLREEEFIQKKDEMSYEMILGLRLQEGVSIETFQKKYQTLPWQVFDLKQQLDRKNLILQDGFLKIPEEKFYISNEILLEFVD